MSINYLKELFFEKYGEYMFFKKPVEVLVILTPEQFKELNDNIMESAKSLFLLVDENDFMSDIESVLYTRINVPEVAEFIIEVGEEFHFGLLDKSQEHGDEKL